LWNNGLKLRFLGFKEMGMRDFFSYCVSTLIKASCIRKEKIINLFSLIRSGLKCCKRFEMKLIFKFAYLKTGSYGFTLK
jgi:hypothetical protein